MDFVDEINQHRSWFLTELTEFKENELFFILSEGITDSEPYRSQSGDSIFDGAFAVDITEKSRRFRVSFYEYVAYLVVNESYDSGDEHPHVGDRIRIFEQSHFIEHLKAVSWADNQYPGLLKQYTFVCENHIINVVSHKAPMIKLYETGQEKTLPTQHTLEK